MKNMKKQLVKLGSTNPELRPHIREILKSAGALKPTMKIVDVARDWLMDVAYLIDHGEVDTMDWDKNELTVSYQWLEPSAGDLDVYLTLNMTPLGTHVTVMSSRGQKFKLDVRQNSSAGDIAEAISSKLR